MEFKLKGSIMTSEEVKALLNDKYSLGDECLIAFEVNEGTGSNSGRRIDALAMHLWPSKDYELIGFEIKVSRSDWLNERKQPEKSLAISQYCDKFYLVAPPGVLGIDELPKTWGYIQVNESGLYTKIKAPKRKPIEPSKPFMASMLRNMVKKYQDKNLLTAQIDRAREKLESDFEERFKVRVKRMEEECGEYRRWITEFNTQTGLQLSKWNSSNIAHSINLLKEIKKREQYMADIENQNKCLEAIIEGNKKSILELSKLTIG